MSIKKVVNTAFGGAQESKEGVVYEKFIGVAPFFVLGVNPNTEEMEKLFPDREFEGERKYSFEKEGEKPGTFVTFIIKNNEEHPSSNGYSFDTRASYLVKNEIFTNKDKTKFQAINAYGDTVWLTKEQFETKDLPEYAVNQGYNIEGMRPALIGEADLIEFIRTFLNIPISRKWDNNAGKFVPKQGEELKQCLCSFSLNDIKKIADGDVTAVRNAIKIMPKNQIKFLCGVRVTEDGREYQDVYSRMPIRFNVTDYKRVNTELQKAKDAGAYPNSDFGSLPFTLVKYSVKMTNFDTDTSTESELGDNIFGTFDERDLSFHERDLSF